MDDNELRTLIRKDPLHEAEQITGKSYKDDDDTSKLGLALHMMNGETKRKAMQDTRDVYYGMPMDEFDSVVTSLGFERVYSEIFVGERDPRQQVMLVWFHPEGGLIQSDTYGHYDGKDTINGWSFNYVFQADTEHMPDVQHSRAALDYTEGEINTFAGSTGNGDGLRLDWKALHADGVKLVNPWPEKAFGYFGMTHHGDKASGRLPSQEDYQRDPRDYYERSRKGTNELTLERLEQLPQHVRDCIEKSVRYACREHVK